MAITQTGSVTTYNASGFNSNTVSSSITVPSDATLVLVGVSGWSSTSNYFSSGTITFTKGGSNTAMTATATGSNAGDYASPWYSALFYLVNPDTGSNKTLTYDWVGSNNPDDYVMLSVIFFKGIDTASPVRSSGAGQSYSAPYATGTMTAVSGDLIVAWVGAYVTSTLTDGSATSWTNLSLITQVANINTADGAWASGSPSGNTAVSMDTETGWDDGSISAVVLKAAASAGTVQGITSIQGISSITI